jgi:hypothetical protein
MCGNNYNFNKAKPQPADRKNETDRYCEHDPIQVSKLDTPDKAKQKFNDLIYNSHFKSYKDFDNLLGVKRFRDFYKEPTYNSFIVNNHHLFTYSNLYINNLMLQNMISNFNCMSNNQKDVD